MNLCLFGCPAEIGGGESFFNDDVGSAPLPSLLERRRWWWGLFLIAVMMWMMEYYIALVVFSSSSSWVKPYYNTGALTIWFDDMECNLCGDVCLYSMIDKNKVFYGRMFYNRGYSIVIVSVQWKQKWIFFWKYADQFPGGRDVSVSFIQTKSHKFLCSFTIATTGTHHKFLYSMWRTSNFSKEIPKNASACITHKHAAIWY